MKRLDISSPKHPNTFTLLDDEDHEWAKHFKWTAEKARNTLYVRRAQKKGNKMVQIRMHRDVIRARSHEQVDHKNGNGLDNRKCNLRICDHATNQQNRIKRVIGKSGSPYKGVFFRRRRSDGKIGRCFAAITINKKKYSLGTFDTDIEAAKEYDSKALYYFGDMARLNFSVHETIPTPI
jgi:hypothetical protein